MSTDEPLAPFATRVVIDTPGPTINCPSPKGIPPMRRAQDADDDCRYWRLNLQETAAHHGRLARYHARLAAERARKANRQGNLAMIPLIGAIVALALSLAIIVMASVMS